MFVFANIIFYNFRRDEDRNGDQDEGEKKVLESAFATIALVQYNVFH